MRSLLFAIVLLGGLHEAAHAQIAPPASQPAGGEAGEAQQPASTPAPPQEEQEEAAIDPAALGYDEAEPQDAPVIKDPFERWNRGVFAFNSKLDRYFIAPLAIAYAKATPRPLRRGISNALANVSSPVSFANNVLQGKFRRAGVTLGRLILNSTAGVGGFIDVGAKIGLQPATEDFGQTIAVYGAPPGPYLFLPFLGPSTVRDALAQPVDILFDPLNWTEFMGFRFLRWSRVGFGALDARAEALRPLAEIQRTSPDPYVTIRTLYALARQSAVRDGKENEESLPEFDDPMDTSEPAPAEPPPAPPAEGAAVSPKPQYILAPALEHGVIAWTLAGVNLLAPIEY